MIIEYVGLIAVFAGYAIVDDHRFAAGLYVLDHLFFAFAIAIKTYFQKIADPKDIASTAGVSFTINHIAAVAIPAVFGLIWIDDPGLVFYLGSAMAVISLLLALMIPVNPKPGRETTIRQTEPAPGPGYHRHAARTNPRLVAARPTRETASWINPKHQTGK